MTDGNCVDTTVEETCDLKAFERNKYFYGKLMTVRDFETEQRYFNQKRHMLNRLVHGVGLVCGMEVSEPKLAGGKLQVTLAKGLALDCCGREIVVEGGTFDLDETPVDGLNYLYLKYKECWKEPVPSLANPSVCEEVCCYSRIKEDFTLSLGQSAPPAPPSFDWKQLWSNRDTDIQRLAAKSASPVPENDIEAKLTVTGDEYYKEISCPNCEDPKVLLAVIKVSGPTVTVDADETLAVRSLVYTNPMLHELLKSHLTDLDNPHRVTAEQAKALMSINNVGNSLGSDQWIQNVDIESPDGTITVTPNARAKSIVIKTDHSQVHPLEVDPASTNAARDKHVSNSDANRWDKSPISIDTLSNPGGDIDLVAGANISIDHPSVAADGAPQIRISAVRAPDAVTGVVRMTIPKATVSEVITHVVPSVPGYVVSKDIPHRLDSSLPPAIVLGLVTETGVVMEQDFVSQRQLVELIAKVSESPLAPQVCFKALKVDNKKLVIVAVNLDTQAEATIDIRWWAIPAGREVKEFSINDYTDIIKAKLGDTFINNIAAERNIPTAEVTNVIGNVVNTIAAQPAGLSAADVAAATGLKVETIQPILETLASSAALKPTGTGLATKFIVNR